jgi:ubiquitin-protein ligase
MASINVRVMKELTVLKKSSEMFVHVDDDNIRQFKVLFFGPEDSVFHNGVFVFDIIIPDNYPFNPPKVTFLTGGVVGGRMHPNLYQEGKVCLSILNTWGSNEWSPLLTLEKIMITVKAILDNNPISHEPSYQKAQSESYKAYSSYYSLKSIPDMYGFYKNHPFGDIIREHALKHKEEILDTYGKLIPHHGKAYSTLHHGSKMSVEPLRKRLEDMF